MKQRILTLLVCLVLVSQALAQGTAFTYQGNLAGNGAPASGSHDFEFRLFNAPAGGSQVGGTVPVNDAGVTNGLFTVTLDFGAGAFDGSARWLDIAVRPGDSVGAFAPLSPRQPITSTPYAVRAGSLPNGAVSSAMLADGVVTSAKLAPGAVNSLGSPDGSPLTAVSVNTNGMVGIGTNVPVAGLHVATSQSYLNPTLLATLVDGAQGYTNLSGAGAVAVQGTLVAVASYFDSGVTLLDIANPNAPVLLSQIWDEGGAFTNLASPFAVTMKPGLLAVAAEGDETVTLISITNPTAPTKLAELRDGISGFNELNNPSAVAFSGNLLAVGAQVDSAVTLVDISNASAPVVQSVLKDGAFGFTNLSGVQGLSLSGNLLAIASRNDSTVTLVDVSNPNNPVKLAELRDGVGGYGGLGGAVSVALSGNLLAVAAYNDQVVTLVEVSNPTAPVKLAEWGGPYLSSPRFAAFSGTGLLAVPAQDGNAVSFFDVSNPLNPSLAAVARQHLAGFNHLRGASGVAFDAGGRLVAASYLSGSVTVMELRRADAGLTSLGAVGIGTTQPAGALHLVGDFVVEAAQRVEINAGSFELGQNSTASKPNATAIGLQATASGISALALGTFTIASGDYATAMGQFTVASGGGSTAMGAYTKATADSSTALGLSTTASGGSSTAMGYLSRAEGFASTALGRSTTASGYAAMASGESSTASDSWTFAAGLRAKAYHQGAFVWADSQGQDFQSTGNNQFLIRAAGGVGINKNNPASELDVAGTVTATAFTSSGNVAAGGITTAGTVSASAITASSGITASTLTASGTVTANSFVGSGSGLSQLNAAQLTTGTIPESRLPANVALRSGGNTFSGNQSFLSGSVGIGTGAPATKLHVSDAESRLRLQSTSGTGYSVLEHQTDARSWHAGVGGSGAGALANKYYLYDVNAGQTRLVVDSSGSVGINTTAPNNTLHVAGTGTGAAIAGYSPSINSAVYGENTAGGFGLSGRTTGSGYAVYGDNTSSSGYAGYFNGNVRVTGTINPPSDRHVKRDFATVDSAEVLEKVARLSIQTWAYTNDASGSRHLGPVAQDFKAAFGLGADDKSIATVDADGVALAAIQGLNQKLEGQSQESEARCRQLERQLQEKEARISQLEQRLAALEASLIK